MWIVTEGGSVLAHQSVHLRDPPTQPRWVRVLDLL